MYLFQNGNKFTWYMADGTCTLGPGGPPQAMAGVTLQGIIKDGNKLWITHNKWQSDSAGTFTGIDKNGRATEFKLDDGTLSFDGGITRRP